VDCGLVVEVDALTAALLHDRQEHAGINQIKR
jgi:hypothetical protein